MEWIKKVWNDPVGSKVISGIIFALGTAVYAIFNWEQVKKYLVEIYNFEVKVLWFFVAIIVVTLFLYVYKSLRKPKKSKLDCATEKIKQFNKYKFDSLGITIRWRTILDAGHPKPYNIKVYCDRHEIPLRFNEGYDYCLDQDCPNYEQTDFRYSGVKPLIQTMIDDKWYKLID